MQQRTNAMRAPPEQSRVLHSLCSMILHILKFPSPLSITTASTSPRQQQPLVSTVAHISPAAFASLFLGISLALMLFGSITFLVGLFLVPWVISIVLLFYVAAIVSTLSDFCRGVLCFVACPHDCAASFVTSHEVDTCEGLTD